MTKNVEELEVEVHIASLHHKYAWECLQAAKKIADEAQTTYNASMRKVEAAWAAYKDAKGEK